MKYIIDSEGFTIGSGDGSALLAEGLRWSDTAGLALPEVPEQEIVSPHQRRIETLREQYRLATLSLCQIAGVPQVDKLEDTDFIAVRAKALGTPMLKEVLAICDTLSYCLFQLYRLDGEEAWGNI